MLPPGRDAVASSCWSLERGLLATNRASASARACFAAAAVTVQDADIPLATGSGISARAMLKVEMSQQISGTIKCSTVTKVSIDE